MAASPEPLSDPLWPLTGPGRGEPVAFPANPGAAPVVVASDLAAAYGSAVVWEGANFSVGEGEFVAVLGPNGAGKSTLIRMVLGLIPPAAGRLVVLGDRPRKGHAGIGYVPQGLPVDVDTPLTGSDLVALGLDGHRWGIGLPGRRARAKGLVQTAVQAVEATAYADEPVGRLSGGQLQRLILAQAVVGRPRLLVLDEPLAGLDLRSQSVVAQLVGRLCRELGLAVILVAHDVNPLLGVIDRVLYMAERRVAIGPPEQIVNSSTLSDLYGVSIEVLTDSRGRLFVVGAEDETSHHHA